MDRAERSVELVISRRGYGDAVRTVDLRDAVTVDVSLIAVPKVTTRPPRKEPKKPVTPETKPPPKGDPSLDIRLSR